MHINNVSSLLSPGPCCEYNMKRLLADQSLSKLYELEKIDHRTTSKIILIPASLIFVAGMILYYHHIYNVIIQFQNNLISFGKENDIHDFGNIFVLFKSLFIKHFITILTLVIIMLFEFYLVIRLVTGCINIISLHSLNFVARTPYEKKLLYNKQKVKNRKTRKLLSFMLAIMFIMIAIILIVNLFLTYVNDNSLFIRNEVLIKVFVLALLYLVIFGSLIAALVEQREFLKIKKSRIMLFRVAGKNIVLFSALLVGILMVMYLLAPFMIYQSNISIDIINRETIKAGEKITTEISKLKMNDDIKSAWLMRIADAGPLSIDKQDMSEIWQIISEILRCLPFLLVILFIFGVVLPFVTYSQKLFVLGIISNIAGVTVAFLFQSNLPELFRWQGSFLVISGPIIIITYIICTYIGAYITEEN